MEIHELEMEGKGRWKWKEMRKMDYMEKCKYGMTFDDVLLLNELNNKNNMELGHEALAGADAQKIK